MWIMNTVNELLKIIILPGHCVVVSVVFGLTSSPCY